MNIETLLSFVLMSSLCSDCFITDNLPLVLTTWPYQDAVNAGECSISDPKSDTVNRERRIITVYFF